MEWDTLGTMFALAVGFICGILLTLNRIRATRGLRECRFVIKWFAFVWATVVLLVPLHIFLPGIIFAFIWVPYVIWLPWASKICRRRQERIRAEEGESPRSITSRMVGGLA